MTQSKSTIYSGTLNAFITDKYTSLETLKKSKNPVNCLSYSATDMTSVENWVKIGTAKITVTTNNEEEIVTGMVNSIDAQIKETYAQAESKINLLKKRKSELLAITMENLSE